MQVPLRNLSVNCLEYSHKKKKAEINKCKLI